MPGDEREPIDWFEAVGSMDIASMPEHERLQLIALLDRREVLVEYAALRAEAERLRMLTVRPDGTVDGQSLAGWMAVHDRMAGMCAPAPTPPS